MKGLDMAKPKKAVAKAKEFAFEKGDFVVYPTHGVGKVIDIEAKEIAGHKLDLFVISFEQERMMLRVPVAKAKLSGLRKLSSRKIMENALVTLKGRSRVSRAMWNRRAQEYEAKINFGDRHRVAGVDLGFVLLRPAVPHGSADAAAALKGHQRVLHDLARR